MERVDDRLPVLAHRVPRQGQRRGPRDAADRGVDAEPQRGHLRDSGGQRDERPDYREHAPDQHGLVAVPVEPGDAAIDVVLADADPFAPAPQRGFGAVAPHRPGDVAAGHVTRGPGQDHADQVEVGAGDRPGRQGPAERHDQLGGHRDARRLRQHEHEDGEIAVVGDELLHGRLLTCYFTITSRGKPRRPGPRPGSRCRTDRECSCAGSGPGTGSRRRRR